MNKINLFAFIFSLMLATVFSCFSQKCKFETNDIDNVTKETIKVTKKIIVCQTFNDKGIMSLSKINNSYSLSMSVVIFVGFVTTYEGCELIFLLENGKVISLKKNKVNYDISKNELLEMLNSKVKTLRFQYGNNQSDTKFYERTVKSKYAENIIDLIKCVYN